MKLPALAAKTRLRPRLRRAAITAGVALVAPIAAWWLAVHVVDFPRARLEPRHAASLTVLDAAGNVLRQDATTAGGRETWVALPRVAHHLVAATIASEDRRFWQHAGVDPVGVARAAWLDLLRGRAAFGGSTLTMQLARLIEPRPRNLWGKFKEAVVAGRIERAFDKREILEQYLNRVYYGNGAWGAEAAARFYFGKPAAALSLGEGSFLAVLPRGPEVYDPFRHLDAAVRRRRHILGLMVGAGLVSPADRELAERTPLVFRREHPELRAPHFVEHVLAQLTPSDDQCGTLGGSHAPRDGLRRAKPVCARREAGVTVETTLDWPLQNRVEIAVRDHLETVGGRGISQAGLVVIRNSDGAVLAMVGSRDYFDTRRAGAVNVTTILRRPGSTLKPFVYALALEAGDSPATLAYDVVLPGETRETYTHEVKQHGLGRYRESLAGSYNLAAVHTLARVGPASLVERLSRAGMTTFTDPPESYPLSLAIGEAEFRIIEYAGAFAAFGNGGRAVVPRAITRVRVPGGQAYAPPAAAEPPRVFSPEVAYLVFDMLADPDARRPMFGSAAPMVLDFPVALKTGTTRAYTDDLAFGTTAEYTVGAWAGNFDGTPTAGVMAMQGAAPMVRAAFVALAARFGTPTAPARPDTLERGEVCALSGMRPGPDCPHKHESFAPGTRPRTSCTWHRRMCGRRELVWPPELAGWARAHGLAPPPRAFNCPQAPGGGTGPASGALAIVYPADGARFLLDPERPPALQRPPLRAMPAGGSVRWTIDGVPVDRWLPAPGSYVVKAAMGGAERAISISFE